MNKPTTLIIDFETRASLNLNRVSTWRYAADETTEVLCAGYAVDDGPIALWTPGAPVPAEILAAATEADWQIAAHNANFEFLIINRLLAPRFGWPAIPIDRFTCTMAMARASALPGSLDGAAAALGLAVRKDKAGAKLMKEIATRKREHPTIEEVERLYAYCRQDVEVERAVFHRLPQLTEAERSLWLLDQEINARGLPVDRELAIAVADLAKKQRLAVNNEIATLTGGKVTTANQRDRIIEFLSADGCKIEGLTKADVKKALGGNTSENVRKLLELRAVGSQAAASKVDTLLGGLDRDDRLRETLVFHGAATGRWSGRRFQPQNLRKPAKTLDVDAAIVAIKSGDLARVEALGQPLSIAADVSRGLICAQPGYVLVGADLSAIESRILAWLAGERWKLQSYAEYDETGDPQLEPYCQTASKILNRTVTPDDEEGRTVGKVADLACGYGGGVGAWKRFATKDTRDDAAIKADVGRWRKAHPRIVRFWTDVENALKRAVRRPGKRCECGRLNAECRDGTLWLTLPSGRAIAYPEARLTDGKFQDTTAITFKDNAMGKWKDVVGWYGTFVENAVQATARDVLAAALMRLEANGFNPIAHVHDEAICEIPEGEDRRKEFLAIMTASPPWADGLPLAGKAWEGKRFIKSDKPAAAPTAEPADEEIPTPPPENEQAPLVDEIPTMPEADEIPIQRTECKPSPDFTPLWEDEDDAQEVGPEGDDEPQQERSEARGSYSDEPYETEVDKPYEPVRRRLLRKGYGLKQSWAYTLPGAAEPLYFEDRYELTPARQPTNDRPRKECRFRYLKDGKELSGTGPRRVIYNWPAILAAGVDATVFITEGANKCDSLITKGLLATAVAYHSWKSPECVGALAGRPLIYFEDHDLPDEKGRVSSKLFSGLAEKALSGVAASFRIVPGKVLWENLGRKGEPPHGWDVKDWIEQGGDATKLAELGLKTANVSPQIETVCAADIKINAVTWLWPNRFAVEKLGIIAGLPDEGKGQIINYVAARVTTGGLWPCKEGQAPIGNVVYLQAEDGLGDTVVPRLKAAGADLTRVHFIKMVQEAGKKRMFSLQADLDRLRSKIVAIGGVKLVLIDPISAYMGVGKIDSYRTTDVRAVLGPLTDLAEQLVLAIIGILHFNKKVDVTNALLRISDSLAYGAAARHVYGAVDDSDNGRKLLVRAKNNLAQREADKTLAYRFYSKQVGSDPESNVPIIAPFIEWDHEYVDITATEAMSAAAEHRSPGTGARARELLRDLLTGGELFPEKEIQEIAKEEEISMKTMNRAKKDIGVKSGRLKDGPGWGWYLPQDAVKQDKRA